MKTQSQQLKAELKAKFPLLKVSVRNHSYSMGNSINVNIKNLLDTPYSFEEINHFCQYKIYRAYVFVEIDNSKDVDASIDELVAYHYDKDSHDYDEYSEANKLKREIETKECVCHLDEYWESVERYYEVQTAKKQQNQPKTETNENDNLKEACSQAIELLVNTTGKTKEEVKNCLQEIINDELIEEIYNRSNEESEEAIKRHNNVVSFPSQKPTVDKIIIHWSEASCIEEREFRSVKEAVSEIRSWYSYNSENLETESYDKAKLSLYFTDGSIYSNMRLDINQDEDNPFTTNNVFKQHIQESIDWYQSQGDRLYLGKPCSERVKNLSRYINNINW